MLDEIKRQTKDLLAYYPGRGKISLLWLVVLPIFWFLVMVITAQLVESGKWPGMIDFPSLLSRELTLKAAPFIAPIPYMISQILNWIYILPIMIMLIRICHSQRKIWSDTVQIMISSLLYALIVIFPGILLSALLAFIWTIYYAGSSAITLFFLQTFAWLICVLGSLLLLLICLGYLSHRFGVIIPFLMFIATVYYKYLIIIPVLAGVLRTVALPLSPTITILRHGMLNWGIVSGNFWIIAFLHATIGYTLAYLVWKKNTGPEDR
jgi:hypothetical protein